MDIDSRMVVTWEKGGKGEVDEVKGIKYVLTRKKSNYRWQIHNAKYIRLIVEL